MQPFQRPQFICSAIEQCKETVNCCPHKQPHIKDERCVPRECRYALGAVDIDCVPYDPEKPSVPVPELVPVSPAKIREIPAEATTDPDLVAGKLVMTENSEMMVVKSPVESSKEQDIKEAVKKQAASKKPAKSAKKGGKRVS